MRIGIEYYNRVEVSFVKGVKVAANKTNIGVISVFAFCNGYHFFRYVQCRYVTVKVVVQYFNNYAGAASEVEYFAVRWDGLRHKGQQIRLGVCFQTIPTVGYIVEKFSCVHLYDIPCRLSF